MPRRERSGGMFEIFGILRDFNYVEIPDVYPHIREVQALLREPHWSDLAWWRTLRDALAKSAQESADITKTEVDDEFVEKVIGLFPILESIVEDTIVLVARVREDFLAPPETS